MATDGSVTRGGPGGLERIRIFLRLRPVTRQTGRVVWAAAEEPPWVDFTVPRNPSEGLINNSRESYRFAFDGVLPPDAQQQEVFERVALPVLRSALDGYNGTVFAFGQTGSGKTFTITGGAEHYADRGLIPRALSALFAEAAKRGDHTYTVRISYMEIYNEVGYDLLSSDRKVQALEDLPKVHIMEDDDSRMHFQGLSLHHCSNEEEALNLLFLGDTNRVVAETPLNHASSRSHCVFTLHIEARRAGEPLVRRSKLHFVDLAGSERAGKTGLAAQAQLREAKYINLSLHFLEQVIVSLQEGRSHVPYRNSVLTLVLRDSLGGNTRTVMVAAAAPEAQHVEESIATCRFAQRVAMVANRVEVNEELDLEVVIKRLKAKNTLLRQELQLLRSGAAAGTSSGRPTGSNEGDAEGGGSGSGAEQRLALTEAEQHVLRRQVATFVQDPSPHAVLNVEVSMPFIRAAFDMLKGMVCARAAEASPATPAQQSGSGASSLGSGGAGAAAEAAGAAELRTLRQLVQQQEQQIGVLTGVLRKQGLPAPGSHPLATRHASSGSSDGSPAGSRAGVPLGAQAAGRQSSIPGNDPLSALTEAVLSGAQQQSLLPLAQPAWPRGPAGASGQPELAAHAALQPAVPRLQPPVPAYSDEVLADKNKAFEYFCSTSPAHDTVAEHKALLRARYEAARVLGAQVNAAKRSISQHKARVEQRQLARSMAALMQQRQGGADHEADADDEAEARREEEQAKSLIEQERAAYHEAYGQLKAAKAEIDGMQAALEHARARLQRDFQAWYAAMAGSGGEARAGVSAEPGGLVPLAQQAVARQPPQEQARAASRGAGADAVRPRSRAGSRSSLSAASGVAQQDGSSAAVQSQWSTVQGPDPSHQPQQARLQVPETVQQHQQPAQPPGQPAEQPADPYAGVDAEVLAAARPLLTGNPQADADIIKFYQARAALLRGMQ